MIEITVYRKITVTQLDKQLQTRSCFHNENAGDVIGVSMGVHYLVWNRNFESKENFLGRYEVM